MFSYSRIYVFLVYLLAGCSNVPAELSDIDLKKDFNEAFSQEEVVSALENLELNTNKRDHLVSEEVQNSERRVVKEKKVNVAVVNAKKNKSRNKRTGKSLKIPKEKMAKQAERFFTWPFAKERHKFIVSFMGMDVGNLTLEIQDSDPSDKLSNYLLSAQIKTNKMYNYIYPIDDVVETHIDSINFLPFKTSVSKKEGKKTESSLQLYDVKTNEILYFEKKTKKGKTSKFKSKIKAPTFFLDVLSMIHYFRFLDFSNNKSLTSPMILKNKKYIIKVSDVSSGNFKFKNNWVKVFILKIESYKDGKKKKKGNVELVFSKDSNRVLYSIKGHLKIGHLAGKLIEYERN